MVKKSKINYYTVLNISQIEPGSAGSTKPVTLIAKSSYSDTPLETPPRILEATPLLYFSIAKLSSILQQVIELTKKIKEKENRKKQNTRNKMK